MTLLVWVGYFITSFLGSFVAVLMIMHWHLEHLWENRHRRIEMKRAQRQAEKSESVTEGWPT